MVFNGTYSILRHMLGYIQPTMNVIPQIMLVFFLVPYETISQEEYKHSLR